ncbi:MAG: hypothetical protein NVS9B3_09130 [Gemmatimonadaceae bacterium]
MRAVLGLLLVLGLVREGRAQGGTGGDRAALARVYVDCPGYLCDGDFLRTEITFVDHVRDRAVADAHVLVTTQRTASASTEYTLTIIGRGRFAGTGDTLVFVSQQDDSEDARRRAFVRTLKLGLVRFAAHSPAAARLTVGYAAPSVSDTAARTRDPWDYWVFRVSSGGNFNGDAQAKFAQGYGDLSANRITEAWKFSLTGFGQYTESKFDFGGGRGASSYSHSYGVNEILAKSLGEHWSAGVESRAGASTYLNQQLSLYAAPAVEYDIFPYSESTRHQLTLHYAVGINHFRYNEMTIFDRVRETRADQRLTIAGSMKQTWGSASTTVTGSHFLDEPTKQRLDTSADIELHLFKGLSLNAYGNVAFIRDQIYLRRAGATDASILLRQRQLATSYRYNFGLGLSYTFGSIYNNIVNPRFRGGGGGRFFFF